MAAPIYVPPDTRGAEVGNALGYAIAGWMKKREQDKQLAQMKEYQDAIVKAPTREDAIDIFTKIPFQTIDQMQVGKAWLDTVHPPKDTTPREVTKYDPNTGAEITSFVPQSQLTGLPPQEKPRVEEFYKKDKAGNIQLIGTFPEEKRPAGSVTLRELEQMRAERTSRKEAGITPSEDLAQIKTYNAMLGNLLNVQKIVGNEIILDFGGNKDKEAAYKYAVAHSEEFRRKFPNDPNRAAFEALQAGGGFAEPQPESAPVTPAAPQGGFISSLRNMLLGSTEDPAAPANPSTPAPQAAAQGKAPQQAIDYLRTHNTPAMRKAFKDKYGYLPE